MSAISCRNRRTISNGRRGGCRNAWGNPQTGRQRRKIGQLKEKLGWEERQVRALCHRMYRVDAVEWLTYYQCQGLIEAMKAILERKPEKEDGRG